MQESPIDPQSVPAQRQPPSGPAVVRPGMDTRRCDWCGEDPLYQHYHDTVWGRPVSDSVELFAKLCLDGQQAGLSWITILRKQPAYEDAFDHFDPHKVATYDEARIQQLLQNSGIVRNALKIRSVIRNAQAFLALEEKGQPFNRFLWDFLDGQPRQHHFRTLAEVPTQTALSQRMSTALKKAGFSFVGPTIVYAFMQATGMVNDHLVRCPGHSACAALPAPRLS